MRKSQRFDLGKQSGERCVLCEQALAVNGNLESPVNGGVTSEPTVFPGSIHVRATPDRYSGNGEYVTEAQDVWARDT